MPSRPYTYYASLRSDAKDDDAAHLPVVFAIIASVVALYLAFVGPTRQHAVVLQGEWRVQHTYEKPVLSLPHGDAGVLIVTDGLVKLVEKPDYERWRQGVIPREVSRASLLGRTKLSRGREVSKGIAWDNGVVISSQSGIIFGLSIIENELKVIWENAHENYVIEDVFVQHSTVSHASPLIYLLARSRADPALDAKRSLFAIHASTGRTIWILSDLNALSATRRMQTPEAIEAYPVRRLGNELRSFASNHLIVSWTKGIIVLKVNDSSLEEVVYRKDLQTFENEAIEADTDGDGLRESLRFGESEDGCIEIASRRNAWKDSLFYSNCTSNSSRVSLSPWHAHAGLVRRRPVYGGASILQGNLSITRKLHRGYDVVLLNAKTGQVTCVRGDGSVRWNSKPVSGIDSEFKDFGARLWALDFTKTGTTQIKLSAVAEEATGYFLVIGLKEVAILRADDGFLVGLSNLGNIIVKQPMLIGSKISVILENDDVVVLSLQTYRDFIPPLFLIPVMIILCLLWACVMWSKLEDV